MSSVSFKTPERLEIRSKEIFARAITRSDHYAATAVRAHKSVGNLSHTFDRGRLGEKKYGVGIVRRSARPVTFFCRRVFGRKTASIDDFDFCIVRHCVEGGIQGFIDKKAISLVLCELNWATAPKRFNNLLVCRSRFILRSNLRLRRLRSCVTVVSKTLRYDCIRDFRINISQPFIAAIRLSEVCFLQHVCISWHSAN